VSNVPVSDANFAQYLPLYTVDKSLVDYKLLTKDEARWLQDHNDWCKERLKPLLKLDKRALKWLRKQ
jgi:hypothetical protein